MTAKHRLLTEAEIEDVVIQSILELGIVNVGRPGPWGNPYRIGRDGTRAECVAKHRVWFLAPAQAALRERARLELAGRRLWCPGCRDTLPCHSTVIEEVANG